MSDPETLRREAEELKTVTFPSRNLGAQRLAQGTYRIIFSDGEGGGTDIVAGLADLRAIARAMCDLERARP